MRRAKHALLLVGMAIAAAGCGSTRPTKYYVLDVPAAPPGVVPGKLPVSLLVARPVTSHLYRDDRIVFGSGPVQLGTYEFERWANTPADMMQDLLINSLRATGQYRSVLRPGTNARGDYIIRSYLRALYEVDQPELVARFDLRVELYDPHQGAAVWSSRYFHDEPVGTKTVAGVVQALDKNVQAGMQQITSGLGQYFVDHPPKTDTATQ
jgi:cholesterol transport system auxiliary component